VSFQLYFTARAQSDRQELKDAPSKAGLLKQVNKALGYLQINPRHPSLNTHVFSSLENPYNPEGKVVEAYAQNQTPGAYRIFWCYGSGKSDITVIAITPHP
jgi:hypothetical protein